MFSRENYLVPKYYDQLIYSLQTGFNIFILDLVFENLLIKYNR